MNNQVVRVLLAIVGLGTLAGAQSTPKSSPSTQVPSAQTGPRHAARSGVSGTITGTVKDDTGGVIPGASITLANERGTVQTVKSNGDGSYIFRGVPPGVYTVSAAFTGLQQQGVTAISLTAGQSATGNITMTVQAQRQEVTVTDTGANTVSTDPSSNATALVLKQEDLDALPDDPDDLEADLQALAGPSAGPGGNQIYIDGFTGGRLPPKDSIREIRINSNPFSAEFDKLGYGRIQIFTKPGSDKFHGQGYYNISDGIWNSRNPFLVTPGFDNPPFRTQLFGGNVSGPLTKHGSFFIDVERRQIDDNAIITASIPTPDLLGSTSNQSYYSTPQRRTTVSPRMDYQLNSNNTLSFRYSYLDNNRLLTGIGGFNLPATTIGNLNYPSNGYSFETTEHSVQLVETAVLNTKAVNETHFQFDRTTSNYLSQSLAPTLQVSQSFVSGGSGYGAPNFPRSYDLQNVYELQNYTSITWGPHTTKFGIRIRTDVLDNSTAKGFNGVYSFLGGNLPVLDSNFASTGQTAHISSIQQYLTTEQLLASGRFTPAQIVGVGYGPSKYSITSGNPYIGFHQIDIGPFIQDDWRVRPNLTLSLGFRWESQTNIPDQNDWAPRVGFAWSPNAKGSGRPKTVIRGGWGMFYDRFGIQNVETAYRYSTSNQKTYNVGTQFITDFNANFDTALPASALANATTNSAQKYQIDGHLQAPRLMQTAIGVERQLWSRTTLSLNFMNSRGVHELRTVNINSPFATPGALPPGATANNSTTNGNNVGVRPFGPQGDIFDYQSSGTFKQTQFLLNVNTSVGRWLSLFGRYSYTTAHSDTDGLATLPSDPYNFAADWGRSNLDIAHSVFVGGSISTRWGLRFSPFIVGHTGTPFNVTTGTDLYLQGNPQPTARPGVLSDAGPLYYGVPGFPNIDPALVYNSTPLVPTPGTSTYIARNAGTGPGFFGLNLRVSKTWGFGTTKFTGPSGGSRGGGGRGGPRGGGGFGGGFGGGRGPGGDSTEHRYNLTVSINARNIINHENLNTANGSLTSPYFLESTNITGGFGAEATASNQRRIDLQLRFAF